MRRLVVISPFTALTPLSFGVQPRGNKPVRSFNPGPRQPAQRGLPHRRLPQPQRRLPQRRPPQARFHGAGFKRRLHSAETVARSAVAGTSRRTDRAEPAGTHQRPPPPPAVRCRMRPRRAPASAGREPAQARLGRVVPPAANASHSGRPSSATSITSSSAYHWYRGVVTASAAPVMTSAPCHGRSGSANRSTASATAARIEHGHDDGQLPGDEQADDAEPGPAGVSLLLQVAGQEPDHLAAHRQHVRDVDGDERAARGERPRSPSGAAARRARPARVSSWSRWPGRAASRPGRSAGPSAPWPAAAAPPRRWPPRPRPRGRCCRPPGHRGHQAHTRPACRSRPSRARPASSTA